MRLTRHGTGSPHSGHPRGRVVGRLGTRLAPSDSAWPPSPRCHAPLLQELREACTGQETPDGLASCGWGGHQHDLDSCRAAIYNSILLSSSRNVTHTYSLDWDMLLLHHTLTHSLVGGKASPRHPIRSLTPHTRQPLSPSRTADFVAGSPAPRLLRKMSVKEKQDRRPWEWRQLQTDAPGGGHTRSSEADGTAISSPPRASLLGPRASWGLAKRRRTGEKHPELLPLRNPRLRPMQRSIFQP